MAENLSLYKIFHTVAKTGNISKASKELYISQPGVSKAIHRLEDHLQTVLFTRSSRGVSLTQDGTLLFQYVRGSAAEEPFFRYFPDADRRQHNLVQISSSALSAAICPAVSPCASDHLLSVHLSDPFASGGRPD